MSLSTNEAEQLMEDPEHELVPCVQGAIPDVKRLLDLCLEKDIPAVIGSDACDDGGCKTGCSPKAQLVVRDTDVPAVMELLRQQAMAMMLREGTLTFGDAPGGDEDPEGEPPCPACGTAAPLVEGACSDCGLQLG